MLEIEYGREAWKKDPDAAYAEALRRIRLTRDATDPEDRRTIWFSDLGALTAIPPGLGEVEGLEALQVGDGKTPDGGRHMPSQSIGSLAPLAEIPRLRRLNLRDRGVTELSPLRRMSELRELDLRANSSLVDIAPLAGCKALQSLYLYNTQVADIAPLAGCTALQSLDLRHTQVADIAPLAGCTALQSLNLRQTQVTDIAPLAGCTALQSLDLHGTQVADIAPLAGCTALQSLSLYGTQVADIAPLAGCTALQSLDLHGTQVADIAPLAGCTALQSLDLHGTQVADIAPLAGCAALQTLYLSRTKVADIAPLASLQSIANLDYRNTPATKIDSRLDLLSALPDNRRARDTLLYLSGEHPDFRPPPAGAAKLTGATALIVGSPVKAEVVNGKAEIIDSRRSGAPDLIDDAEFARRLGVLKRTAGALVRNLETAPNAPASLRAALTDYRDSLHEGAAVYEALDILMNMALADVNSDYVSGALTAGQISGVRALGKEHAALAAFYRPADAPPPAAVSHAPPPDISKVQPGVLEEKVNAAREAVAQGARAGVVGDSAVDVLNAATRLVQAAKATPLETPAQEATRKSRLVRAIRTAGGTVAVLSGLAGIHGWASSQAALDLLTRLKPILDYFAALF